MDVLVSTATLWEIAIKHSIGKLSLAKPFAEMFPSQLTANAFELLPIRPDHLARLVDLPSHHRYPFDRLLVAQAQAEKIMFLSRDGWVDAYDVETAWE